MLNVVTLIGRLTADPELRKTTRGTSVVNFTLAVDRDRRENGEVVTDFVECTAWSFAAEFLAEHAKKGGRVAVNGRLQESRWVDKKDGQSRRGHFVMVDNLYPLSRSQPSAEEEVQPEIPDVPSEL